MQMQLNGLNMTPVLMEQLRATLWQKTIRTENAVRDKTGNSLKTMVQTISKHQQVWRLKPHVCKSQKRGWNIPSYHNRDSKAQKKDHQIY
jgi:hypothetical protein